MSRSLRTGLAALLLAAVALFSLPGVASAHAVLESSTPAANSVIEVSPPTLELRYDEAVNASLASVKLFDGKGKPVVLDTPRAGATSATVVMTLPKLSNGLYAVVWRVTSVDGHVVDGAFSFQIGSTPTGGNGQNLLDQVRSGAAADRSVVWLYGVGRFLALAGVVLLAGVGLWSLQGRPDLSSNSRFARLRWPGWAAFTVGAALCLSMYAAEVHSGRLSDAFSGQAWNDAIHTDTGRMLLIRLAMALGFVVVLLQWEARQQNWWRALSITTSIVTIASFSASGHANALQPRVVWIAIDMLHLIAIVVWVGGLIALAMTPRAWLAEPEAVRPVHRFSFAAAICVPVIVGTGLLQTWKLAGTLDDVTATTWGRLLLSKVVLVVAMVAIGGVSRWLLLNAGTVGIRRTVVAEAIIGVVVIGLAAAMVAQAPRVAIPSRPYSKQLTSNGVIASVTISPGSVGHNEVHIFITPPGGSLRPVTDVKARVLLASASIPESPVTLKQEGPNHYSGSVTFPRAGQWTLQIIVNVNGADSVLLNGTVPIP
ncbi:MAG: copper resistance protein CopC [Actinomycetota bacterium]